MNKTSLRNKWCDHHDSDILVFAIRKLAVTVSRNLVYFT